MKRLFKSSKGTGPVSSLSEEGSNYFVESQLQSPPQQPNSTQEQQQSAPAQTQYSQFPQSRHPEPVQPAPIANNERESLNGLANKSPSPPPNQLQQVTSNSTSSAEQLSRQAHTQSQTLPESQPLSQTQVQPLHNHQSSAQYSQLNSKKSSAFKLFRRASKSQTPSPSPTAQFQPPPNWNPNPGNGYYGVPTRAYSWSAPSAPKSGRNSADNVRETIGWLCGTGTDDWSIALKLCDDLSSSEYIAKEGARTLRKEIEHGISPAQARAARLLVILVRNSTDRFKFQVVTKRFLDVMEKVYRSKNTEAYVKSMLFKALSVLAYEYQGDYDLSAFTRTYNRIKSPDEPTNGLPLPEGDNTFDVTPRSTDEMRHRQPFQQHRGRRNGKLNLWSEAEVAQSIVAMLSEALAFTEPKDFDKNEVIREMYTNLIKSQEVFVDAIPWATQQAELSRARVNEARRSEVQLQSQDLQPKPAEQVADLKRHSRNPFIANRSNSQNSASKSRENISEDTRTPSGVVGSDAELSERASRNNDTNEQKLLNKLLQANAEIIETFKLHDDMLRQSRQEQDIKKARDMSLQEQGAQVYNPDLNKSQDAMYAAAISENVQNSRRPLPRPPNQSEQPYNQPQAQLPQQDPFATGKHNIYHNIGNVQSRNPFLKSQQREQLRLAALQQQNDNPEERLSTGGTFHDAREVMEDEGNFGNSKMVSNSDNMEDKDELGDEAPRQPSAKALGKLRRFSTRPDIVDDDAEKQQQELEKAMRARYAQNYEEYIRSHNTSPSSTTIQSTSPPQSPTDIPQQTPVNGGKYHRSSNNPFMRS